jgi:hypothetical protein
MYYSTTIDGAGWSHEKGEASAAAVRQDMEIADLVQEAIFSHTMVRRYARVLKSWTRGKPSRSLTLRSQSRRVRQRTRWSSPD